jgi:hypothetical protein
MIQLMIDVDHGWVDVANGENESDHRDHQVVIMIMIRVRCRSWLITVTVIEIDD